MFRGSSPAKIDDKGRLKVPTAFRQAFEDTHGPAVFVTSVPHHEYPAGHCIRIYPMAEWERIEQALAKHPSSDRVREQFVRWTSFFGQEGEIDAQGRLLIHQHLREAAGMRDDVHVFGHMQFLEVWNVARWSALSATLNWSPEDTDALAKLGV